MLEIKHGSWEKSIDLEFKAGKEATHAFDKTFPGLMWVRLYSAQASQTVAYRLRFTFEPIDLAGNIPAEAFDVVLLGERQVMFSDYVGPGDSVDYYKFQVNRSDTISVRLLDLAADANVELLTEEQVKLAESVNPRNNHEEIDYPNAKPGTYFVRVY